MKKIYLEPESEVIMLSTVSALLVGSTGDVQGGNDDGQVIPSTGGDPNDFITLGTVPVVRNTKSSGAQGLGPRPRFPQKYAKLSRRWAQQ